MEVFLTERATHTQTPTLTSPRRRGPRARGGGKARGGGRRRGRFAPPPAMAKVDAAGGSPRPLRLAARPGATPCAYCGGNGSFWPCTRGSLRGLGGGGKTQSGFLCREEEPGEDFFTFPLLLLLRRLKRAGRRRAGAGNQCMADAHSMKREKYFWPKGGSLCGL
jgi:hypothetical protein